MSTPLRTPDVPAASPEALLRALRIVEDRWLGTRPGLARLADVAPTEARALATAVAELRAVLQNPKTPE